MTEQTIDDFIADRLDEDFAAIAVKCLGEDAGLEAITAWVTLHKAAPDLLTALEEIAAPDGLTEASAGAMVYKDLRNKKRIARAAIAKATE